MEPSDTVAPGFALHLIVDDIDRSLAWYEQALGATVTRVLRMPDGTIATADLRLHGLHLALAEPVPGTTLASPSSAGVSVAAYRLDVDDADAAMRRAVEAGAEVSAAVDDAFWGVRTGEVLDPSGHRWAFDQQLREVPDEEIEKLLADFQAHPAASPSEEGAPGPVDDEAEIRRQLDALARALHVKDLAGVKSVYASDVVSFDIDPPLQHVGIEAKLKNWENAFAFFDDLVYDIRELTVTVGTDVAFAHGFGRLRGTLKNGAATDGMWVRATFGFRKVDGRWTITHDQVSVPLDIATGRGVVDLEPRSTGAPSAPA